MKAAAVVLFCLAGQGLSGGELDDILARYLPAKARTELAGLTKKLEKLEKDHLADRVAKSSSPGPAAVPAARIAETEAAVGTLIGANHARADARGWQRLREHLLRRYEGQFLPRAAAEEIEAALPQAARRKTLASSYSAASFLKGAAALLPSSSPKREILVRHRERTARLQSFSSAAPEYLRLSAPDRMDDPGGLLPEEKKRLLELLSAGRIFSAGDWSLLAAADPLCRTLLSGRLGLFAEQGAVRGRKFAAALETGWGEYARAAELLFLASASRVEPPDEGTAAAGAPAEPPADPNFRKNLADGRDIADRVLDLFARGAADSGSAARLAVLELLNHRSAGRLFLTSEKYLSARPAFFAFLDRMYAEIDAKTAMLLGPGGAGTSAAVRGVFQDVLRREGFTVRVVTVYREETASSGFPNPFEIDPAEARAAYARAFWTVTQGAEPDLPPEAVEEWAQAHGQVLIPLPLLQSLRPGEDARSLFLASYPDGIVRNFPDFGSAFDGLARELAFPWFRWSFKITFPLLKTEYRARGFEALLAAHRIVCGIFGLPAPGGEKSEDGKILEILASLRDLRMSVEDAQKVLAGNRGLPEAADGIISVLRNGFLPAQGEFLRISGRESAAMRGRISGLSGGSGDFPREAAAVLRLLNDRLAGMALTGGEYLDLRARLFSAALPLLRERGGEAAAGVWLASLVAAGIVSERERSERSVK